MKHTAHPLLVLKPACLLAALLVGGPALQWFSVALLVGLFAGTYLAEYGKHDKLTSVIRFINDILLSAPSIIIGLFIYGAVVVPMRGFSAIAGALEIGRAHV